MLWVLSVNNSHLGHLIPTTFAKLDYLSPPLKNKLQIVQRMMSKFSRCSFLSKELELIENNTEYAVFIIIIFLNKNIEENNTITVIDKL